MRWVIVATLVIIGMQVAHAAIEDEVGRLIATKTEAENDVRALKSKFLPTDQQYVEGKAKYTAAQDAFNSYTRAVLTNFRLNAHINLQKPAELASSRARDFHNYV